MQTKSCFLCALMVSLSAWGCQRTTTPMTQANASEREIAERQRQLDAKNEQRQREIDAMIEQRRRDWLAEEVRRNEQREQWLAELRRDHPDWPDDILKAIEGKRVRVGMTAEQATASWGQPSNISRSVSEYGVYEVWYYGNSSALHLRDGNVTIIATER